MSTAGNDSKEQASDTYLFVNTDQLRLNNFQMRDWSRGMCH